MKQTWPILPTFLCCVISEAKLGIVDVLANNHTCCVLETTDPDLTSDEGSGIRLPTVATIAAHFAINTCASMSDDNRVSQALS